MSLAGSRLAAMPMDQLADHVYKRSSNTAAIYVRKELWIEKNDARMRLIKFFGPKPFPKGLSILTMPSLKWAFERALIDSRERKTVVDSGKRLKRTCISCFERDEAIYRVALKSIPQGKESLAYMPTAAFATSTVKTKHILRFHRCSFSDFVALNDRTVGCAWLDFFSLSSQIALDIQSFYVNHLRDRMALTFMLTRWDTSTSMQIEEHGGIVPWLEWLLPGSKVIDVHCYSDGSPMIQLVIDKMGPSSD